MKIVVDTEKETPQSLKKVYSILKEKVREKDEALHSKSRCRPVKSRGRMTHKRHVLSAAEALLIETYRNFIIDTIVGLRNRKSGRINEMFIDPKMLYASFLIVARKEKYGPVNPRFFCVALESLLECTVSHRDGDDFTEFCIEKVNVGGKPVIKVLFGYTYE